MTPLKGVKACLQDRKAAKNQKCTKVRALDGPATLVGSNAIAVSPDGRHVYATAAGSNAVVVLRRNAKTGALTQSEGPSGCVSQGGESGCRTATALRGANSLTISKDGDWVFVTGEDSDSVTAFARDAKTGGLKQKSCVTGTATEGCETAVGLDKPAVVVASPDGAHLYAGTFGSESVVTIAASKGALSPAGCIAKATEGCATGIGFGAIEGLAISPNGNRLVAAAPFTSAVLVLNRDAGTGALTQASDGTGCWSNAPLTGCTTGRELASAAAVAMSADGRSFYTTNVMSQSLASFRMDSGVLTQLVGGDGCLVNEAPTGVGCRYAREFPAPEGAAVTKDGRSVYAVSPSGKGSIIVLDRSPRTGAVVQKAGTSGCVLGKDSKQCTSARALSGVMSVAVSPDGRNVYAAASKTDAIVAFKRTK